MIEKAPYSPTDKGNNRPNVKDIIRKLEFSSSPPVQQTTFARTTKSDIVTRASILPNVVASTPGRSSSSVMVDNSSSEHVSVFLRIRPNPVVDKTKNLDDSSESTNNIEESIQVIDDRMVSFRTNRQISCEVYSFTHVFPQFTDQQQVFDKTTMPLIDNVFHGSTSLLFAYGVTNAGKTYTIMGKLEYEKRKQEKVIVNKDEKQDGIIPRVMTEILKRVQNQPDLCVAVSYFELYKGKIYDLLNPHNDANASDFNEAKRKHLRIAEENNRVVIKDLMQRHIDSSHQGKELLMKGNQLRIVGGTAANKQSSRSHGVFTVTVLRKYNDDQLKEVGKISLVDLAGAERASKSGAEADQLKEASEINMSLLVLSRCLTAIAQKQNRSGKLMQIPYRESDITKIFKNELLGNAKICMIANVSPSMNDSEETANIMKLADIVKDIKTNSKVEIARRAFMSPNVSRLPFVTPKTKTTVQTRASEIKKKGLVPKLLFQNDDTDKVDNVTMIEDAVRQLLQSKEFSMSRVHMERTIREEMASEFALQIEEMETQHQSRLQDELSRAEERYLKVVDHLNQTIGAMRDHMRDPLNSELMSMLFEKDKIIADLEKDISNLRSCIGEADLNNLERYQLEKLALQREIDELSDKLSSYTKYERENEMLRHNIKQLEEKITQVYEVHSIQLEELEKRNNCEIEVEKTKLQTYIENQDSFESEIKEKYRKQFEAKAQIETENVRQELKELEAKYNTLVNDNKVLRDAYNGVTNQNENSLKIVLSSPATPIRRGGSLISPFKTLANSIKKKFSLSQNRTPNKPTAKQPAVGSKRKSDQLEPATENDDTQPLEQSQAKKIKLATDTSTSDSPKVPKKVQTTKENESPQPERAKARAEAPKAKTRIMRLRRAGVKSLLEEKEGTPVKKVTRTRVRATKKIIVESDSEEESHNESGSDYAPTPKKRGRPPTKKTTTTRTRKVK